MTKFKLLSALAVTMLCLGFASCDRNKDSEAQNPKKNLIGTWEDYWEKGWERDSADPMIDDEWDYEIPAESRSSMTFNADHTLDDCFCSWRLEGNTLYIDYDPDDLDGTESFTIKELTTTKLVLEEVYTAGSVDFCNQISFRKL